MSGTGTIEFFMKHPELLEQLPKETLEGIMELVRAEKARLRNTNAMPPSAVQDLVNCVGDQQVRDIVNDLRKLPEPGWFLLATKDGPPPRERTSGWRNPPPLTPPPGVGHIDRIAEHFADMDRRDLEKRLT
jgi:hypothetical protein